MSITIEELRKKLNSGEAILLPNDRNRQGTTQVRISAILKGNALTRDEISIRLGFKKQTSTINYMEKKGIVRAVHFEGARHIHYVLAKELEGGRKNESN
jgi:hypothetical protein